MSCMGDIDIIRQVFKYYFDVLVELEDVWTVGLRVCNKGIIFGRVLFFLLECEFEKVKSYSLFFFYFCSCSIGRGVYLIKQIGLRVSLKE